LGAITKVGRFNRATTCAIVKVLPDPVTPSSTWPRAPSRIRAVNASIAAG
jgi:hypothetical protein